MISAKLTKSNSKPIFWNAYQHFSLRLKERFDEELSFDDYLSDKIIIRNLENKQNSYVKYFIDDKILVYFVLQDYEFPITIYMNEKDKYKKKCKKK